MFWSKRLTGQLIAKFRLPIATWRTTARIIYVACLFFSLGQYVYSRQIFSPVLFVALLCSGVFHNRDVRFYERGVLIPKGMGDVFLSRDQVQVMKLDGPRLVVTGPDADWGGPYSGGTFPIRHTDLARLQQTLARFTNS